MDLQATTQDFQAKVESEEAARRSRGALAEVSRLLSLSKQERMEVYKQLTDKIKKMMPRTNEEMEKKSLFSVYSYRILKNCIEITGIYMGKGKLGGGDKTMYVQQSTTHLMEAVMGHHNVGCKALEDTINKAWEAGDKVSLAEIHLHGFLGEAAYYLEGCTILQDSFTYLAVQFNKEQGYLRCGKDET